MEFFCGLSFRFSVARLLFYYLLSDYFVCAALRRLGLVSVLYFSDCMASPLRPLNVFPIDLKISFICATDEGEQLVVTTGQGVSL